MRIRRFLSVVPKAVQVWALILAVCAVLIALAVGLWDPGTGGALRTMSIYGSAGLVFGILIACWVLGLGFVYADARRRLMRPVLWVVVAALVPHLLGFLLYFVMRQPIASACTHCGHMAQVNQRFCAWCGSPRSSALAGAAPV